MMEMIPQSHSKSVAKCNFERKDDVEVNSKTSSSITHQEEKAARSLERDVMVERVSSTTEHHSWRNSQKQQSAEMSRSTETMLEAKTLSRQHPREEKDKHSGTPRKEEAQHRSHKSKHRSASSSGREKRVRGEHSRSKSISRRNETLQYSTSSKRHSERETKGADPEVSSSSLVGVPHGRAVPPPPWIGSLSGCDDRKHDSLPHTEKERCSKSPVRKDDKYKDKRKQKYYKERDKETRHKDKRADISPHISGSKKSTNYEKLVELQVREIRNNLTKINREVLETREEPMSKSVHSETSSEKYRKLRESQDTQDTLVAPFLPSSRCCSPPRPTEITKYWSDADETEDESDTEKHMMHINSVNIVLNYMKAHSDKYYKKEREPVCQNKDGETVKPKGSIKERLTLLSRSSQLWRGSKGVYVKKQGNFNKGKKMHSRLPAKQQHASPFVQENESPTREQYDCPSRLGSELSTVVLDLLASLSNQQSGGPSRFTQQHCRSSHSPPRLGESRSSRLYSTHRDGELCSPRYEQRPLRRESCSPLRQKSDSLRNRESLSPSWYSDDCRKNRLSQSPSSYRDDFVKDRESHSPSRHRGDPLRNRGPHSLPQHRSDPLRNRESHSLLWYRDDPLRNRRSRSPSRYRDDPLRNRRSRSPSRYRDDPLRNRRSRSPSLRYRDDPLRNRRSRSPSRYRGDLLTNRSHSPPRHRRDPLRNRGSRSPSRYKGDSLRNITSHSPGFRRTMRDDESPLPSRHRGDSLRDRESHSPSSSRSDFFRDNESHTTSRYRDDSLRDRESHTPGYGCDSLRDKESHTPGYRGDSVRDKESHTPMHRGDSLRDRESHTSGYISNFLRERWPQNVEFTREKETLVLRDREFHPSVSDSPPLQTSPELQQSYAQLREPHFSHELSQRNHIRSSSFRNHCGKQNNKNNVTGNRDYFFNPAVEDNEDCMEDSESCPQKNQMQKGKGQFTESGSLSYSSRLGTNTSAPVAAAHVNNPKESEDVIQSQLGDSNNQRNFAPRSPTQIFPVGSKPTIGQPEDFYLEDSSTDSSYHQPPFVPNTHGRQLLTGLTGLNEPNLPGPSGASSAISSGIRDVNDSPYWFTGFDHDSDLEDFDNCLSEVSTLIADHEAATSDKTPSNAGSVVATPIEHEAATTQSARQEKEKQCLTLNSTEMTTLLSLIEIAKEHTTTGDDLSNSLPKILDKIRKTTTTSKNDSETSGGQYEGDKKERPDMFQGRGGMQDSTMDAGTSKGTSSDGNVKSKSIQRGNKGAALSCNEDIKQLSKDKISKNYTVKKLSGIKDSKSQQSKDTPQAGKVKGKPSAGGKHVEAEGNSQLQQKKSEVQEKKANDKPSPGKMQDQSRKKETSDIPLQNNEVNKEKPLKNKMSEQGIVKRKKSEWKNHSGKGAADDTSSIIKNTFANMQCVKVYVGDLPASTESVAESNTSLKSQKKRLFKQLDEKLPVNIDASESSEAKKSKDTLLPHNESPETVHPLHQETIVLDHSVDICLACKHKLVADKYTSFSLATGTVTMRCRVCCTFTKMEKVIPHNFFKNIPDLKRKTFKEKSTCNITSEDKKTLHSSKEMHKAINKEKNVTPSSTSTSQVLQDSEGKNLKTLTKENKTSTSVSKSKARISRESKEESSRNFDSVDPSQSKKRKEVLKDLKLSDDSSDSVEAVIKPKLKRPTKRRRIIKSPSSSEDEDDTSRLVT